MNMRYRNMDGQSLPWALIWIFVVCSCSGVTENAQSIVDKSIEKHGGTLYENSIIEFDFRDRHYILERDHGKFTYHRIFKDSTGTYHDILNNNGFKRLWNEREMRVDTIWTRRYSNSVNSVAYFALLPFGLNDKAVNKSLIGEQEINGKEYYKIQVTFDQKGGGEDFEDIFVYWINKKNYLMEYLGYHYLTNNGGIRFREAINIRKRNGLIFSDYINYEGPDGLRDVAGLGTLFMSGKLARLSEIKLENLKVNRLK